MVRLLTLLLFMAAAWAETVQQPSFWQIYTDALRGNPEAQYKTGVMYERGMGIDKNETQAAQWYEKSAIQGYVDAQYNIAIMYASGRGVQKNEPIAMMWLALAAKQGDKEARKLLLEMIDGKIETHKKETPPAMAGVLEPIVPVSLVCHEDAKVCAKPGGEGECTTMMGKTVLTSKSRSGSYYKISGIIVKRQWKDYLQEGWIDAESVDVRK